MRERMKGTVVQCLNCGTTIRCLKENKQVELMILSGWGKVRDACYCHKCIKTWNKRNKDSFEQCGGVLAENLQK